MKAKFINPYTDFGFKKLFGQEANKDLLIDFLNPLLPPNHQIAQLSLRNNEALGDSTSDRGAIFDIYCESHSGEKFIVEMQKSKLNYFKDRAVFYTTFPIREQAEKGDWNFCLKPIYCVALLDFVFDDEREKRDCLSDVKLRDQNFQVFYDKLTYIFIEMPRFQKTEAQLETHFDKWLYFLKHLEDFDQIPSILNEPVFVKGFEVANLASMDEQQKQDYQISLKHYRDLKGVVDTAYEDGFQDGEEKGLEEGILEGQKRKSIEFAKKLKQKGYELAEIEDLTGLSRKELENL